MSSPLPPLELISSTDKAGLIVVLTALSLTFILVSFLLRIFVRWTTAPWKNDDNLLLAATILACVQSALVFFQVNRGLGKTASLLILQDIVAIQKAAYASDLLYICILWLSKCSLALLYLRLTPSRRHVITVWIVTTASTIWAVMSILVVALRCHVLHPWTDWGFACVNLFARWQVIGALDIVTEAALFLVSLLIVQGVRISQRSKSIVVGAFGLRLLIVAPCVLRLHYLNLAIRSSDETLVASFAVVCTQFEISYGILANTIPCLKPFIAPFEGRRDSNSAQRSAGGYKFKSFGSGSHTSTVITGGGGSPPNPRPSTGRNAPPFGSDQLTYMATVLPYSLSDGNRSVPAQDTGQMIIETKIGWSVEYEGDSSKIDVPFLNTERHAHASSSDMQV